MTTTTLIYYDQSGYQTKVKQIRSAVKTCNEAIFALNESLEIGLNDSDDFEQFMKNPLSYFDAKLIEKLEFKSNNPNCELLASLHNINRQGFIEVVYNKTPRKDCAICSETDSLPQFAPCTLSFNSQKDYLLFNDSLGESEANEPKIAELEGKYRQYATPEEQKKIDFANEFIAMINKGMKMGLLGSNTAQDLKRAHIGYNPSMNQISLPENIGYFINLIKL